MTDFKNYLDAIKRSRVQSREVVTTDEAASSSYDPKVDGPRVVLADEEAVARFRSDKICGQCAHFLHRRGQEEAAKQGLFKTLFDKQELGHDPAWYGSPGMFGLCEEWEGHLAHALAPCKIPKHFLDSTLMAPDPITGGPKADKDHPVNCPHYRESGQFRRQLKVYMGGGSSYDPE